VASRGYAKWSDVKAGGGAADPRTSEERSAGKAAARERREAYMRGCTVRPVIGLHLTMSSTILVRLKDR